MLRLIWRCTAAAVVALCMAVPTARADTIKLVSTGVSGTGPYTYTFQVTLDNSGELVTGANVQTANGTQAYGPSFLTLYDIPGTVTASYSALLTVGANTTTFAVRTSATGVAPESAGPTDSFTPRDPNIVGHPLVSVTDTADTNVTIVYTGVYAGPGLHTSVLPTTAINGDKLLGVLTVVSTVFIPPTTDLSYIMQDNNLPHADGKGDEIHLANINIATPLPATANVGLALLACLGGMGGLKKMRANAIA